MNPKKLPSDKHSTLVYTYPQKCSLCGLHAGTKNQCVSEEFLFVANARIIHMKMSKKVGNPPQEDKKYKTLICLLYF
jgi:hypothetical protein